MSEPTVFTFRHKHDRVFHYIADDGEPKDIRIKVDLPAEISIPPQYKVIKKPTKLSAAITLLSPISEEEIHINWEKTLEERLKLGKDDEKLSATVQDDVEAYVILASLWPQLIQQIKRKQIGGLVALRKLHSLLYHQEQHPDMSAVIDREIEGFDPITDARLHGIRIRYGDPDLAKELERFPNDREILTKLGVRSEYGKRVILRAVGVRANKFMEAWEDASNKIAELEKLKEQEEARLEKRRQNASEEVQHAILDMTAALKDRVEKEKRMQREWQDSQLNAIWNVMFPQGERPASDWEKFRERLGG